MMGSGPGFAVAIVGTVAVIAIMVAAEIEEQEEVDARWAALCANVGGDRIEDDQCGDWDENGVAVNPVTPGNYFMWIDTSTYSGRAPGIGQRITVGQRGLPSGAVAAKGLPKTGGDVSAIKRGGFGVGAGKAGGSGS